MSNSVTRVVLDANYYRGAPATVLSELVDRGLKVSVSVNAFAEHWLNTHEVDDINLLVGRALKIAPYVDPVTPLLPTGLQLIGLVGGSNKDGRDPQVRRFMTWAREAWAELASGNVPREWWGRGARAAEVTIDDSVRAWNGLRNMTPGMFPEILALPESDAFKALKREFLRMAALVETLPGNVQSRKHAFWSVTALHTVRAFKTPASYSQDPNDAEDIDLLQHLATPAILATRDFGLIRYVDDSGSSQAPWVLTLGEILNDGVPSGLPWGKNARRVAARFRRRNRRDLAKLEEQTAQRYRQR